MTTDFNWSCLTQQNQYSCSACIFRIMHSYTGAWRMHARREGSEKNLSVGSHDWTEFHYMHTFRMPRGSSPLSNMHTIWPHLQPKSNQCRPAPHDYLTTTVISHNSTYYLLCVSETGSVNDHVTVPTYSHKTGTKQTQSMQIAGCCHLIKLTAWQQSHCPSRGHMHGGGASVLGLMPVGDWRVLCRVLLSGGFCPKRLQSGGAVSLKYITILVDKTMTDKTMERQTDKQNHVCRIQKRVPAHL